MKALVNGYFRGRCPIELACLNRTEQGLISLIKVFSSITLLPKGGAYASNGNVYSMLNAVSKLVSELPEHPNPEDMAFLRLKEDTSKTPKELMYCPFNVKRALCWLEEVSIEYYCYFILFYFVSFCFILSYFILFYFILFYFLLHYIFRTIIFTKGSLI